MKIIQILIKKYCLLIVKYWYNVHLKNIESPAFVATIL